MIKETEPILSIARPAWKFFLPLLALALVASWFFWPAGVVLGLFAAYVLYFFRDPRRRVPNIPGAFVSPADGEVVSVIEVPSDRMPGGRAKRVAIFLNVFNVHVQRSCYWGRVIAIDRKAGKFGNAMFEKCSEENEQLTLWLQHEEEGVFGIRQIAGAIARRIVCHAREGTELERGERYGLIQFGSRVEIFLPLHANVKVAPGQKVRGGESLIALIHEEETRKGRPPENGSRASQERLAKLTT